MTPSLTRSSKSWGYDMAGWVKLHRSLSTSAIASKPDYLAVWVHLLMDATHKPTSVLVGRQVVDLEPGQLVFGRKVFSVKTGVSEAVIRSSLNVLQALQQITIKSTTKYSVISITNWSKYQEEKPSNDQQRTSNEPATNHIQEVQEIQEKIKSSCDQQAESRDRIPFEKIRSIYNRMCTPVLPEALKLDDKRKRNIRKCYHMEIGGVRPFQKGDFWEQYFSECLQDQHWIGKNDRAWRADIEFLTRETSVLKVLERT